MSNFLIIFSTGLSYFFFFFFVMNGVGSSLLLIFEWEFSDKLALELGLPLVLDIVSLVFVMTVLFISGSVMFFSGFYMSHENFMLRFIGLVNLFVVCMVLLVMFPSYLALMIGWDGLGVVSFLLVVYYMNSDSLSAGMITAISNRVGDVFFILVIGMLCCSMSFLMNSQMIWYISLISLLILLGSMTKSAQIPFSAWLPEAMAAPTPVSTLVHSSTLVTAVVYVLIRFNSLLSEISLYLLMFLSLMTVIMAGSGAMLEVDMKKVVALSTLSQVGMMMFSISVGAVKVAFFHLVVHAFFKALMFICVGGVIFYSGGFQDGRFLSGLWLKLPLTCSLLLFSNMSLMAFPFMSGFYSKELILAVFLSSNYCLIGFVFLIISLVLTISYSIRMMMLMMKAEEVSCMGHYNENNIYYLVSMIMMMNGSTTSALIMQMLSKDLIFYSVMSGKVLYSYLIVFLFWFLNVLMVFNLMVGSSKAFVKYMVSMMWFLKPLSGSFISSRVLLIFSKLVRFVEMGWIRGYIWGSGLSSMMFGGSQTVHKLNLNLIGLVSFATLFLWVVILL